MSELKDRFLPRFIELANDRVKRVLASLGDAGVVSREMHSLAGEAGMLGLSEISTLAVEVSAGARGWNGPPRSEQQLTCARQLRALKARVEQLKGPPPRRALVIDDSALVAEELAYALRGAGFEAAMAATIDAAVAELHRCAPQVVLIDANMPGVELPELFARVREHAGAAKLVIVSGTAEDELQGLARSMNADGCASKLEGVARVVERVTALLHEGRR